MSVSKPSRPSHLQPERDPSERDPSGLRRQPAFSGRRTHPGFECPERDVITSEIPVAVMLEAARIMTEPSPPVDLRLSLVMEKPAPATEPRPARPLAADLGLQELIESSPMQPPVRRSSLAHGIFIACGALALGLASLFAVRTWSSSSGTPLSTDGSGSQQIARLTPSSRSMPVPALGCVLERQPVKLDDWAVAEVRPSVVALPGSSNVVLAYAQSHRHATGGEFDPVRMKLDRSFGHTNERQIFSVTPLVASGAPNYQVERMGGLVAYARPLDVVPPLRIGLNDAGLVIGPLEQRGERIWELPAWTLISVPEVASYGSGLILVLRAGRNTGHLHLGRVGNNGAPLSELAQIGSADSEYGRPALVSGPEQTVLAVSQRVEGDQGYALLLARAPNGELPLKLAPLELPGTAGLEVASPALAALPDGGFALMWSQGTGPARQVRVQRLSAALLPLGDPLDVSAPDAASGGASAGALFAVKDGLLAFYFLRRDDGHSLWVGRLGCGAHREGGEGLSEQSSGPTR